MQSNFGGVLTINGAPVGREPGPYYLKDELTEPGTDKPFQQNRPDGSIIIVIATKEAIYNSLLRATATTGRGRTVEALPLDRTLGKPSPSMV